MSVADVVNVAGSIGGVASAAKGIASSAQNLMSLFGGGDYASKLRKASYNGVPFAVVSESGVFGRNVVVHSYPKKETRPWIEDNGLKTNVLQITGFLVENSLIYGGGDVTRAEDQPVECDSWGLRQQHEATGHRKACSPDMGRDQGELHRS